MPDPSSPSPTDAFARAIWTSIGGDNGLLQNVQISGTGDLPSAFAVSDLAAACLGTAGLAIAELVSARGAAVPMVRVDRRRASFWFGTTLRPEDWTVPPPWDPVAGDYQGADGWIRLHTNAPHHRDAALSVLNTPAERDAVTAAVAQWRIDDPGDASPTGDWVPARERPLAGIRVLDLTRVLAGPVATRFLAGFGADVLRVDPPDWDEPGVIPEVTLGKRCARLNLRRPADRRTLEELLAAADVMVHGYRPDALIRLGLDPAERHRLRPGLVDVSLDAYGWSGPWRERRGFDSLVQMSSGIAAEGMRRYRSDKPRPLPVQALDHATGYIMATAAIRGLTKRLTEGVGSGTRTSLARTAALLTAVPPVGLGEPFAEPGEADFGTAIETTGWGPARRMKPPVLVEGAGMKWDRPANPLGSAEPVWLPG
jgi:CoA-transferase family III